MCICKYIYNIYLNLCLILQTKHKQKPHRSSMIIHSKMNFTRNSCETSGPDLTTNLLCSSNFPVPLEPRKNPPILNIIWVGLIGILMVVYMVYYNPHTTGAVFHPLYSRNKRLDPFFIAHFRGVFRLADFAWTTSERPVHSRCHCPWFQVGTVQRQAPPNRA